MSDEKHSHEDMPQSETVADDTYEYVEIEYTDDDIEAYIVDENDNEIGFIMRDETGKEVELYYADDEELPAQNAPKEKQSEAAAHKAATHKASTHKAPDHKQVSDDDNPYDPGITAEGVAETTADMNSIYRDGAAVVNELKDAYSDIASAFDFSDLLPMKRRGRGRK